VDFQDKRTDDMKFGKIAVYEIYRAEITRHQKGSDPEVWRPKEPPPFDIVVEQFRYLTLTHSRTCGNTGKPSFPETSIFSIIKGRYARYAAKEGVIVRSPVIGDGR